MGIGDSRTTEQGLPPQTGSGEPEEISKKDTLRETAISYGQFYRWKRMGLIPESWLQRRATFTGHETCLPRAKLLDRIRRIQALKDRYPLEEIARMLSPDAARASYCRADVDAMGLLSPRTLLVLPRSAGLEEFDFRDLLGLALVTHLVAEGRLSDEQIRLAAETLHARFDDLGQEESERYLVILLKQGVHMAALHTGKFLCDRATEVISSVSLNELTEELKVRLRSMME
jgi:hypothetical protein